LAAADLAELVSGQSGFKANLLIKRSCNTENKAFGVVYQQSFGHRFLLCFFSVPMSQE
jgi:hypothetical protein